jgi:hypothetical protein
LNPVQDPAELDGFTNLPCSAWTAKANKPVQFGYGLNYMIDIENSIIVDVEATPARTYDEVAAARTMVERTEERMGLKPQRLAADTAYGTGKFLGWLVGAGITPQIPVWDKSTREDGTFSRSDFTFDRERNVYVCPASKLLTTTGNVGDDHVLRYLASKRDCDACPHKPQCCPKMLFRKVTRDINEDARDLARALMGTPRDLSKSSKCSSRRSRPAVFGNIRISQACVMCRDTLGMEKTDCALMAPKEPKLFEWTVYVLRQRATYVGRVRAPDAQSAIDVAIKELEIPTNLRNKVSVEQAR